MQYQKRAGYLFVRFYPLKRCLTFTGRLNFLKKGENMRSKRVYA